MKKALLFGCLFMVSMTAAAQQVLTGKNITTDGYTLEFIPGALCCDGKGYLTTQDDNNIYIYDGDLQLIKTKPYTTYTNPDHITQQRLNTSTNEWETYEEYDEDYINVFKSTITTIEGHDLDGNMFGGYDGDFIATQSLFNNDEKFEFIEREYEMDEWVAYEYDSDDDGIVDRRTIRRGYIQKADTRIVNEDGVVLFTIPTTNNVSLYRFGGSNYLVASNHDWEAEILTYDFYKIDSETSSVRKVTSLPTAVAARFSLNGQQLSKARRGINIIRNSDGTTTKLLVK